jgi:chorismate mutase
MDWMLQEQEKIHSRVRRYQSPDEYPYFPEALSEPILKPLSYKEVLHPNTVCVNDQLKKDYIEHILPAACSYAGRPDRGEAQENYGSAAVADVACLQALSHRIHFGKYVAESKFRSETDRFTKLIQASDRKGLDDAITNAAVEQQLLERLALKARTYGTDPSTGTEGPVKINVDAVVSMYRVSKIWPATG